MKPFLVVADGEITYNKELLVKHLRKAGEKSLGGFSVDDALENAFREGVETAFRAIYSRFDDEDEEEE